VTHLEVEKSKVKVTRLINVMTKLSRICRTGRPTNFNLGITGGMSIITDMRGHLQAESSGSLFKSPLARGGGILWRQHYILHSLLLAPNVVLQAGYFQACTGADFIGKNVQPMSVSASCLLL